MAPVSRNWLLGSPPHIRTCNRHQRSFPWRYHCFDTADHCRLHCMGFSCNWLLHNHWRIRTRLPNLFLRPATSCPRDMEDTECLLGGRRTYPRGSPNTFLLPCCRSAHLYRLEKFLYYYHGSSILCLRRQINWGTRTAFRNCTCYPLSTEYTLDDSRRTEVHRYRFEWQVHTDT